MASSKEYLEYVLESFRDGDVTYRPMMGEYLLYYRGKLIGGLYDDRLLVKPTSAAKVILRDAPLALPYEGAKEMLLVEDAEDRVLMRRLFDALYADLPAPKRK